MNNSLLVLTINRKSYIKKLIFHDVTHSIYVYDSSDVVCKRRWSD